MTSTVDVPGQEYLDRREVDPQRALSRLETQIADLERRVDLALRDEAGAFTPVSHPQFAKPPQVMIWGVPFSRLTLAETLRQIDALIGAGRPSYFITANLNYNMLTARHPELAAVNEQAALVLCDGMPMVWWSRLTNTPLPERVAGSELIYALSKWAAIKGHRIYFLGGAPGVAQAAADKLQDRYPDLQVAGVDCPPFRPLRPAEEASLLQRIRASRADIVYLALGQPKGELWMARLREHMGSAVCVQLGASFDFVAGGIPRAPIWMQRVGLEWAFRLAHEPRRLARRYWNNGLFLLDQVTRDAVRWLFTGRRPG